MPQSWNMINFMSISAHTYTKTDKVLAVAVLRDLLKWMLMDV
jgi:hypothetical protein